MVLAGANVTPFEYAVISLFLLIAVLDMRKVTVPDVRDMPRWYIYTFVSVSTITVISLLHLALGVFR